MPWMQPSTFRRDTEAAAATLVYLRGSSSLLPGKPHERDGGAHPVTRPQAFPKGCLLQSLPRKAPVLDLLHRGGSLLQRNVSDPGKGHDTPLHPDRAASQGLMCSLTRQVILIFREVVDTCKVPGQAKHGPLDNHGLVPNLDPFGDNIEGAKGGNSDPLRVEENRRAKG